ncbi:hypothetical protein BAUCODRAFT_37782 [Baudoinia panamericana UAMH 10762]|uniref:DUF833-domain-containing protein n=1 Tax=Baudoinia panamericana (strain UAMH 10762) TaxID=717646 RepID=M2M8Y4_BAUPA|nr:uncharacterized protein BAUCODRAFT_37782 [Baudoinia panamericana UAMH 10762]EMC92866.1 hypothetical protein BAUCODRAFT_37782 [Baudoinia panamericana UAMH 10762]
MCISLLSTAHPQYPFILLNNRDEFLDRSTAALHRWEPPDNKVFGGRDLQRKEQGTWLAITTQGRIANLTNFREEGIEVSKGKSRGLLPLGYVTAVPEVAESDEAFIKQSLDLGVDDMGGFSLVFGQLRAPREDGSRPGLSILSNRTASVDGVTRICTKAGETHGLSNSHFGDRSWPKVVQGEQFLKEAIQANIDRGEDQQKFIDDLFHILSVDTFPQVQPGEPFALYARQMRNTIFVPPVRGKFADNQPADRLAAARFDALDPPNNAVDHGSYGTRQQSVVLVDGEGVVTFDERTLYREDGKLNTPGDVVQRVRFTIEGWND